METEKLAPRRVNSNATVLPDQQKLKNLNKKQSFSQELTNEIMQLKTDFAQIKKFFGTLNTQQSPQDDATVVKNLTKSVFDSPAADTFAKRFITADHFARYETSM